ncbi:hypothetical protein A4W93_06620 [Piscinibacter gummiphilus]|uniref:Porin domain-containing protein n=2 Tax=Piscinibacter gummiphilus TaxID=946333 RepID=A0A1W6L5Y7_9BURK|nr:hypothetical protein A4W93_06620 [Piscinibacter gummiphilus]ATU64285.1 hypothetical protein CPZ87_06705 [Piscinibacter gummiphilus]
MCVALAGASANAATSFGEYVTLSGFGTAGAVVTDNDQDVFVRENAFEGATSSGSWVVDSKLGVQADFRADWFGATAQVLAEQRMKPGIRADLEWAYLSANPSPDLAFRLGRMAPAVFMVSDGRNIGYSNTMVRMPNEVYAVNFLKRVYGVDGTYRIPMGSSSLTLSAMGGKGSIPQGNTELDADKVWGYNATFDTPVGSIRFGQFKADVVLPWYRSGLPTDIDIPYAFTGLGYQYEGARFKFAAEYVKREVGLLPEMGAKGWYATAAYRFGSLTPYIAVAGLKSGQLAILSRSSGNQSSETAGVRWDLVPGAALKLQFDHVDPKGTVGASFSPVVIGPGDKTNVLSIALDFIF